MTKTSSLTSGNRTALNSCSVTSGTYMSILWRIFLRRRWWMLALPPLLCLAITVVDSRFAYVALIVAMAMGMLALPLVYYYGLTQESRWSILKKTVTVTDDGILLDFDDENMRCHVIPRTDIAGTTAAAECLVVRLRKNRYTFLAIPLNAFSGEDELREFVLAIRDMING